MAKWNGYTKKKKKGKKEKKHNWSAWRESVSWLMSLPKTGYLEVTAAHVYW